MNPRRGWKPAPRMPGRAYHWVMAPGGVWVAWSTNRGWALKDKATKPHPEGESTQFFTSLRDAELFIGGLYASSAAR